MNLYGNDLFFALLIGSLIILQLLWHVSGTKSTERNGENALSQINRTQSTDLFFYLCATLAVSSLFRLFPGNARTPMEDSSAFLYIGERILEGKAPYRDVFDHKGPLLYLIQIVGLKLTPGSYTGVWLLEVLNMLLTTAAAGKLAATVSNRDDSGYLAVLAVFGACGWKIWQGGNFTEEYALPWITLAAWVMFRFFRDRRYHTGDIILLGVGFMVVLLLRANMVAVWGTLIPVVLLLLLRDKRFAEIGRCILLFLLGMAVVLIPTLLWAHLGGFLKDMWQDYVIFNIEYTDDATSSPMVRLFMMLRFAQVVWPGTLAVLLSLIIGFRRREQWFNFLFYLASLFTTSMSGRVYNHYAIVLLPAFVIPMSFLFDCFGGLLDRCHPRRLRSWVAILTACIVVLGAFAYRKISDHEPEIEPVTAYLAENTEKDDDVLVLGKSLGYYIQAGRKTENRFFYQLPPLEISQKLRDEFKDELREHPSDYIVISGDLIARNTVRQKLYDVWPWMEQEILEQYRNESYESFEVYIKEQEN